MESITSFDNCETFRKFYEEVRKCYEKYGEEEGSKGGGKKIRGHGRGEDGILVSVPVRKLIIHPEKKKKYEN